MNTYAIMIPHLNTYYVRRLFIIRGPHQNSYLRNGSKLHGRLGQLQERSETSSPQPSPLRSQKRRCKRFCKRACKTVSVVNFEHVSTIARGLRELTSSVFIVAVSVHLFLCVVIAPVGALCITDRLLLDPRELEIMKSNAMHMFSYHTGFRT